MLESICPHAYKSLVFYISSDPIWLGRPDIFNLEIRHRNRKPKLEVFFIIPNSNLALTV